MIKIEKKKRKDGMMYDYVPSFSIEDELIKKLGLSKMPRLGEKMKVEGIIEAVNLGKNTMEEEGTARISFEFKKMKITSKKGVDMDEAEKKIYGDS